MPVPFYALLDLVHAVCDQRFEEATILNDLYGFSSAEIDEAIALVRYELTLRATKRAVRARPHRRAYRLLRSYLTPEQNAQLRRNGHYFDVVGSAGGRYRLWPGVAACERTKRYGSRSYRVGYCCYHERVRTMPSPDVTLGHLLYLLADEPGFLSVANVSTHHPNAGWHSARAEAA